MFLIALTLDDEEAISCPESECPQNLREDAKMHFDLFKVSLLRCRMSPVKKMLLLGWCRDGTNVTDN